MTPNAVGRRFNLRKHADVPEGLHDHLIAFLSAMNSGTVGAGLEYTGFSHPSVNCPHGGAAGTRT